MGGILTSIMHGALNEKPVQDINHRYDHDHISEHASPGIVAFDRHDAPIPSSCPQFEVSKSMRATMYTTIQTTSNMTKTLARCT